MKKNSLTSKLKKKPKKAQIKYWSIHAIFCATPSFLIALDTGFNRLESILAMLFTIACFIYLYAWISSSDYYQSIKLQSLRKIARLGAILRSTISGIGLIGFILEKTGFPPGAALFAPDMMSGIISIGMTQHLFNYEPLTRRMKVAGADDFGFFDIQLVGRIDSFIPTCFTTAFEGLIITTSLLLIILTLATCSKLFRKTRS